jgi:hypothetical protein
MHRILLLVAVLPLKAINLLRSRKPIRVIAFCVATEIALQGWALWPLRAPQERAVGPVRWS